MLHTEYFYSYFDILNGYIKEKKMQWASLWWVLGIFSKWSISLNFSRHDRNWSESRTPYRKYTRSMYWNISVSIIGIYVSINVEIYIYISRDVCMYREREKWQNVNICPMRGLWSMPAQHETRITGINLFVLYSFFRSYKFFPTNSTVRDLWLSFVLPIIILFF